MKIIDDNHDDELLYNLIFHENTNEPISNMFQTLKPVLKEKLKKIIKKNKKESIPPIIVTKILQSNSKLTTKYSFKKL